MIGIPGFQVQRTLCVTPTASVYLAYAERLGRTVALKVLDDAAEPACTERTLAGARLQARLAHPNIVQVLEAEQRDGRTYVAMEPVRGVDLHVRLERGILLADLVNVIGDVARALDHVHAHDIVHRDVTPSNILVRDEGGALLTDFWLATEAGRDAPRGETGGLLGTPAYMSPELLNGTSADGRADLYALGAVVYEALTGARPFAGDTAESVALHQVQDPVPRLPPHLEPLQGFVERVLARQPEQRFATGAELAAALAAGAARVGALNLTLRSEAVSTEEIRAVGAAILASARRPRDEARERRPLWDRTGVRVATYSMLALLTVWWLAALVERSETAARVLAVTGLVQDPAVQDAWNNARSLRRDPNQSLATVVAGYRRVLSLDPNHARAQAALEVLATEWKTDIERALAQGNVTLAANRLAEYLLVFPSNPVVTELAERIRNRRTADNLVNNALAQLRSYGIGDVAAATLAIRSYQEVLRLVPEHPVAQAELDVLAAFYAARAADAAAAGNMDDAIGYLDRANAANSRLPVLAAVREQILGSADSTAALTGLLAQAARYRAAGALIDPPDTNAAELYLRVLATDPGNPVATAGITDLVGRLITTINEYLTAGDLVSAGELVARAGALGLDQTEVIEARQRLESELARFNSVTRKLEEARELLARGLITEPPEHNAVLLLREVESLDPGNQAARAMLEQSAERLAAVAQEVHGLGMRRRGREYLALALSVRPDVEAWQQQLARWTRDD